MTVEKIIMAGVVLSAFVIVMMAVVSCGARPQPMGEDVWLGVRHLERSK